MESSGTDRGQPDSAAHLPGMETDTPIVSGLEPLLSIEELAKYLDVPVATLYDWRVDGKGPCAIRIGRRVKFAVSDVNAWIARQRESSPGHLPGR
jgi:excisionase family DNA binding protein